MQEGKYCIKIKAKSNLFDIDLKEILSYRDLIYLLVRRDLKLRYAQTILGPAWLVLMPFVTSIVYSFVFGDFAGMQTDGVPQLLFYMAGTTTWSMFSSVLTKCSNTFIENSRVFGRVYFPRLVTPISQSLTGIINFGIQFLMLGIIWTYYFISGIDLVVNIKLLMMPVFIIHLAILALSIGIIIACTTVKYKDMVNLMTFGIQLWMFLTPVIYPLSSVDGIRYVLLMLNPVTPIINNFRYVVLGSGNFLVVPWIISIVFTVIALVLGVVLFNRMQKTFTDLV